MRLKPVPAYLPPGETVDGEILVFNQLPFDGGMNDGADSRTPSHLFAADGVVALLVILTDRVHLDHPPRPATLPAVNGGEAGTVLCSLGVFHGSVVGPRELRFRRSGPVDPGKFPKPVVNLHRDERAPNFSTHVPQG